MRTSHRVMNRKEKATTFFSIFLVIFYVRTFWLILLLFFTPVCIVSYFHGKNYRTVNRVTVFFLDKLPTLILLSIVPLQSTHTVILPVCQIESAQMGLPSNQLPAIS